MDAMKASSLSILLSQSFTLAGSRVNIYLAITGFAKKPINILCHNYVVISARDWRNLLCY